MKTDWTQVALARNLNIPADELARIVPSLESLEAAFRPLLAGLDHETESVAILSESAVLGQ
jgi:hypothetical protein